MLRKDCIPYQTETSSYLHFRDAARDVQFHSEMKYFRDVLLIKSLLEQVRSTTQFWAVTRHQYEISVLIAQMTPCEEMSSGVAK